MEKTYQAKDGYIHRKVANNDVLISIGANVANFNGYVTLNPSASFLWDSLSKPQTVTSLVKLLTEEFEVSEDVAKKDVENFLELLQRNSMVTVYENS
jgi:hypothetical protein